MALPLLAVVGIGAAIGATTYAAAGPKDRPLGERLALGAIGGGILGGVGGAALGAGAGAGATGAAAGASLAPVAGAGGTTAATTLGGAGLVGAGGAMVPAVGLAGATPAALSAAAPAVAWAPAAAAAPTGLAGIAGGVGDWVAANPGTSLALAGGVTAAAMNKSKDNDNKNYYGETYPQDASWQGTTYHGREPGAPGRFDQSVADYFEEEKKYSPLGRMGAGQRQFSRPGSYIGRA